MKIGRIKYLEIFTDGSMNFAFFNLKLTKQVKFYLQDYQSFMLSKLSKKVQLSKIFKHNRIQKKYGL
jgi:hypothetical protein